MITIGYRDYNRVKGNTKFFLLVYVITGLLELPWIKRGNGYRKRNWFGGYAMNWVSQMYMGGNLSYTLGNVDNGIEALGLEI